MRKELEAMRQQLQEIRALLQGRPRQPAVPSPPLPAELTTDGAVTRGAADAKLVIVEFSDFQCPFCARHSREVYPQLEREYISTGKARYVFRHFPIESIHPQGFKASEAAACADAQGRFWEMHGWLFANLRALSPDDLTKHAQAVGLDHAKFTTCLAGQTSARVRQDLDLGTFLVLL